MHRSVAVLLKMFVSMSYIMQYVTIICVFSAAILVNLPQILSHISVKQKYATFV